MLQKCCSSYSLGHRIPGRFVNTQAGLVGTLRSTHSCPAPSLRPCVARQTHMLGKLLYANASTGTNSESARLWFLPLAFAW